ncbi:hypothetical protein SS50377_28621 [Spironucleus salmonicida]|uniref:Uncharacterized protein n=1 Tax=Spironucleus salmonicida TaxID=348837 RepID=V6LAS8_9EUKA|nr:hypothetical protein SS50377_28621 [Spironucleus salmonicida]|eukprot:EST41560.1 Hypothetical protein SS50377_18900 [Spironucleus salmonicida]
MFTAKQIFRGNLEFHLKLEQFLYGNLDRLQLKKVRQQFDEKMHSTPQKFHELIVSVREPEQAQHLRQNMYDSQNSVSSIEKPISNQSDQKQRVGKPDPLFMNRNSSSLQIQSSQQQKIRQPEILIHNPELNLTTSVVISNHHDSIVFPNQQESLAASAVDNLKKSVAKAQQKTQMLNQLLNFETGENIENIQKDLKLLGNQVLYERKLVPMNIEQGFTTHHPNDQIKQLRDRIAQDQVKMNEMISEQQKNLAELMELEKAIK